jgi:hypothetical protein
MKIECLIIGIFQASSELSIRCFTSLISFAPLSEVAYREPESLCMMWLVGAAAINADQVRQVLASSTYILAAAAVAAGGAPHATAGLWARLLASDDVVWL